jgi:hypothetical protein
MADNMFILAHGMVNKSWHSHVAAASSLNCLSSMSENTLGRANELRTPNVLSSQSDDNGSRIGQSDPSRHGRPSQERRTLEVKEGQDAAKEAFNGGALAQPLRRF